MRGDRYAAENGIRVAFFGVDGTVPISIPAAGFIPPRWMQARRRLCWWTRSAFARPKSAEFLVRWAREWAGETFRFTGTGITILGLATAIAIAAVRGGATWIQGTINGMGERAGNADIAEVALACGVSTTFRLR